MRLRHLFLLVAGAFFGSATANTLAANTTSSTATSADPLTAGKDDGSVPTATANKDDEERLSFSGLTNLFSWLSNLINSQLVALKSFTWRKQGLTSGDVFKKLDLKNAEDTMMFQNKDFNDWVDYTKAVHPNQPNEALFGILGDNFSDIALSKILHMAMKAGPNEKLAATLQKLQREHWLDPQNNYSPSNIFKALKLDRMNDDLLTNPMLLVFTKYLEDFNKRNPKKKEDLIVLLMNNDPDDALFLILEAAKKVSGTKKLATTLQDQHMKLWEELRYSPYTIFRAMGLDHKLKDLLFSPYVSMWVAYVHKYNLKQSRQTSMIDVILEYYTEIPVSRMLENYTSTNDLATKLQNQLLNKWKNEADLGAHTLFLWLDLKPDLYSLLENPNLMVWFKFMKKYSPQLDSNGLLIDSVMKSYDAQYLKQMLTSAKEDLTTKDLVTNLLTTLRQKVGEEIWQTLTR